MATYLKVEEIRTILERLVDKYVNECRSTEGLNSDFIEIIKHNFFAKYVHYDEVTEMVEIGINESRVSTQGYPEIKVYHYPLSETKQWMGERFKTTTYDLEFYASIINKDKDSDSDFILMDKD